MQPATDQPTLPLWKLPDARSDRDWKLAVLFRNICYLDACGQCTAGNQWLARETDSTPSTVKRLLAILKDCGLIETEHNSRGHRLCIRPLVNLVEVMEAGWIRLCEVVIQRNNFPEPVRRLARAIRSRLQGVAIRTPDLSKLGWSPQKAPSACHAHNCAPSAPVIAPLVSVLRKLPKGQQTEPAPATAPVTVDPAAVSVLRTGGVSETDALGIAQEAARQGWSVERLRQGVKVVTSRAGTLRNPGGFLRSALRGGWLPPAPPSDRPSDRGERPIRVVTAPKRTIPHDWLPGVALEEARALCNEAVRQLRLSGDASPSDEAIRDRARHLWQRGRPGQSAPWKEQAL